MLVGQEIVRNRYKIIREIARGGMGIVYLAKDSLTNEEVALKISTWTGEDSVVKAFEAEAKLLARLRHPRLPKVLDYFYLKNNYQALVMDYIEGDTLYDLIKPDEHGEVRITPYHQGTALDPGTVTDWGIQISETLIYLHSFDPPIIHRDIKPHNLKLNSHGQVILLDFGLAKGTLTSLAGNTLPYSPFEQINRTGTDQRSDIYALGSTLYHLLTNEIPVGSLDRFTRMLIEKSLPESAGAPASTSKTDPQILASAINPLVSPALSALLEKAMSLLPEDRFQAVEEMKSALINIRQEMAALNPGTAGRIFQTFKGNDSKSLFEDDEVSIGNRDSGNYESALPVKAIKGKKISLASELDQANVQSNQTNFNFQSESNRSENSNSIPFSIPAVPSDFFFSAPEPNPQVSISPITQLTAGDITGKSQNDSRQHLPVAAATERFSASSILPDTLPLFKNPFSEQLVPDSILIPPEISLNNKVSAKNSKKFQKVLLVLAGLSLPVIFIGVLYFLIKPPKTEISINSADSLATSPLAKVNPIDISIYRVEKNGREILSNEDYKFTDGEGFRFSLKSSLEGFLYVVSKDETNAVLVYPANPKQIPSIKPDEEIRVPSTHTFSFGQKAPETAWAYFVVVPNRGDAIAKKIEAVLTTSDQSLSITQVSDLIKELDQIYLTNKENKVDSTNLVQVNIQKLQKK